MVDIVSTCPTRSLTILIGVSVSVVGMLNVDDDGSYQQIAPSIWCFQHACSNAYIFLFNLIRIKFFTII